MIDGDFLEDMEYIFGKENVHVIEKPSDLDALNAHIVRWSTGQECSVPAAIMAQIFEPEEKKPMPIFEDSEGWSLIKQKPEPETEEEPEPEDTHQDEINDAANNHGQDQ